MDETLLGWSQLPAGRSAIARGLSELWNRQWPNQIARSISEKASRSKGTGFVPADLVRQADALAADPQFIREQDIIAGLIAWQPKALEAFGLDANRLLARVRELEGETRTLSDEPSVDLSEAEALASSLIVRLEQQELLSTLLAGARRFAQLEGNDVEVSWLHFEAVGVYDYPRRGKDFTAADRVGLLKYMRLHAAEDVTEVTGETVEDLLGTELPRSKLAAATVAELERWSDPPQPPPELANDPKVVDPWVRAKLFGHRVPSMLESIRHEVHRYLMESREELRALRRRAEILGPDAETVFAAGGRFLDELRNAVGHLDRPRGFADAASAARITILTLGRELYRGGPKKHISPITSQTFDILNEKYMLRAYIDDLWVQAPPDRRLLLEAAHSQIEEAYELGSRAKNPFAVSHEEAVRAVVGAFRAARAIALSNGFPLAPPSG